MYYKTLIANGETHTISEWAKITGIEYNVIMGRVKMGWTNEEALGFAKHRRGKMITYKGKTLTLPEWAKITGINVGCIRSRLKYGWPVAEILGYKEHVPAWISKKGK